MIPQAGTRSGNPQALTSEFHVPEIGARLTGDNQNEWTGPTGDGGPFAGLFDRFWDCTISDGETERQIGVIEQALQLAPGDHVLLFPFGACRLALGLAAKGYAVTGIDSCPVAIERCAMLAARSGSSAKFRRAGSDVSTPPGAAAAICLGWSGPIIELAAWLGVMLITDGRALVEVDPVVPPDTLSQAFSDAGLAALDDCPDLWGEACAGPRRVILAARS